MYKVIAFDLDETIGNFLEISILIDIIEEIYKTKIINNDFFKVFDIFPEVFRPQIFKIFKFLIKERNNKNCKKIYIYTNNQGPKSWTENIAKYIDYKLKKKNVFNQIIAAWKVDNKLVEPCRTTHNKTKTDFLNCTKLKKDTSICFIDDLYHPKMNGDNVLYLHVKPYHHYYDYHEMAERYYNAFKPKIDKTDFINTIVMNMKMYNIKQKFKTPKQENLDKLIGKQLYLFIKDFFNKKNKKTRKKLQKVSSTSNSKRKTKKKKNKKKRD